jgi:CheY-like chemotaxis protein
VLIILDLNMPSVDGKSCLKKIKQNPRLASIPVVAFSSMASVETINEIKLLGAKNYFEKPGLISHLQEIIRSLLKEIEPSDQV